MLIDTLQVGSPLVDLVLCQSNDLAAICSDDLCIRVVDIATRRIVRIFKGHKRQITAMASVVQYLTILLTLSLTLNLPSNLVLLG